MRNFGLLLVDLGRRSSSLLPVSVRRVVVTVLGLRWRWVGVPATTYLSYLFAITGRVFRGEETAQQVRPLLR